MSADIETVVGIDVGGERKGFHAVALQNKVFEKTTSPNPHKILDWCLHRKAKIVAVDAPCGWSLCGRSRQAERELKLGKQKVSCFATPTRAQARAHTKGFFDWVFNGEKLYQLLAPQYPLFDGNRPAGRCSFETFPHGIVCFFAGKVVPANPKIFNRRKVLIERGYDVNTLTNIDYIDAALCAVAAAEFGQGRPMHQFGTEDEGFIVLPRFARLV